MICSYCKLPNPDLIVEKDLILPAGTKATLYATLHAHCLIEFQFESDLYGSPPCTVGGEEE